MNFEGYRHPWRALTVKQPWAWLITSGPKDVENRHWIRGPDWRLPFFIHASKSLDEHAIAHFALAEDAREVYGLACRLPRKFRMGGIVGMATLADVLMPSGSPPQSLWGEEDAVQLVLKDRRKLPFVRCKGSLGFWPVPPEILKKFGVNPLGPEEG